MFLISITGGIGSGKSTVSQIFHDLNCPVIDADKVAREVVEKDKPAWHKIKEQFGADIFYSNGDINRDALGRLIFSDEKKRRVLNSITHPYIIKSIIYKILLHFVAGEQFVIMDLPLLFETGNMLRYMHKIVVVYCDRSTQIQRLHSRNGFDEEEAIERIEVQMSLDEKCQKADCVINNEGTIDDLEQKVFALYRELRKSKAHWKLRLILVIFLTLFLILVALS